MYAFARRIGQKSATLKGARVRWIGEPVEEKRVRGITREEMSSLFESDLASFRPLRSTN